MTGAEIAGAAAGRIIKAAGSTDKQTQAALAKLTAKDPYMKVAAAERAKRIATKEAALRRVMSGIAHMVGIRQRYFEEQFPAELAARIAYIPDENIIEPSAAVAFPALQGLGYSLDEATLREMYLNLLAAAVDSRRTQLAHPAFAEIIKQLSPAEAGALLEILPQDEVAAVEVRRWTGDFTWEVVSTNVIDARHPGTDEWMTSEECSVWVDNWSRLGLVRVDYSVHLSDEDAYDWCNEHPNCEITRIPSGEDGVRYEAQRGGLIVTDFGRRFWVAVANFPGLGFVHPDVT